MHACYVSFKRSRTLFASVLISIIFAIIIPVLNALIIYPAFTGIIVSSIEEDAKKLGAYTLPPSLKHSALTKDKLTQQFFANIYKLELDFSLLKIRVFSSNGDILYSTDTKEIGGTNTLPYFMNIVAKGNSVSKLVTRESLSLEGLPVKTDVVETYVPFMSGERFLGAFEMYYDVTKRKKLLDQVVRYSTVAMIALSACLVFMITILVGKEASRVAMQDQAEALREEVDRIAKHDMKSPLSGILNGIEYLEHFTQQTQEQAEITADMRTAANSAMDMINRSLDLFKMETGRYEYMPVPVDIVAIVRQAATDLAGIAAAMGVTVSLSLNDAQLYEDDTLTLMAEEPLCYSLIANLLKNGIEASGAGDSVTVSLYKNMDVRIVFHNARAVPEPIRATFFNKYTTMGKPNGTGLGTYSAKLMTRTMGGTIEMTTSDQTGTDIIVTLPMAEA